MTIGFFFLSGVQSTGYHNSFPLSNSLFKSQEERREEITEGYLCTKAGPEQICFYSRAGKGAQAFRRDEEIPILWREP